MTTKTPQSAKAKGRRFQQEIAKVIIDRLGLAEADVQSRSMGAGGIDLMLSDAARKAFPFAVECKRQENPNIAGCMRQCVSNANCEGLAPLLLVRENRQEAVAIMLEKDLIKITYGCICELPKFTMILKKSNKIYFSKWLNSVRCRQNDWIIMNETQNGSNLAILSFSLFMDIMTIRRARYPDGDPLYDYFGGVKCRS